MLELNATIRAPKSKLNVGEIPAVFYGAKTASTPIAISAVEFTKVFAKAGEMTPIALKTSEGVKNVLVHDMQRDPVKHVVSHVDFYVVEKGQKVHVSIPLQFTGESPAVKNGGILVKVAHEISVEGDSAHLPQELVVDISALVSADSVVTAGDIALPKGVSLYHIEAGEVVASISAQSEESLDSAPEMDLSAIEVAKKGKKEEEGEASE